VAPGKIGGDLASARESDETRSRATRWTGVAGLISARIAPRCVASSPESCVVDPPAISIPCDLGSADSRSASGSLASGSRRRCDNDSLTESCRWPHSEILRFPAIAKRRHGLGSPRGRGEPLDITPVWTHARAASRDSHSSRPELGTWMSGRERRGGGGRGRRGRGYETRRQRVAQTPRFTGMTAVEVRV